VSNLVYELWRTSLVWSALLAGSVAPFDMCCNTSLQVSSGHAAVCCPTCPLALSLALSSLHSQVSDPGRDLSSRNFGRISLATASPLTATQRYLASCLPTPLLPVAFRIVPHSFLFHAALLLSFIRSVKTHGRHGSIYVTPASSFDHASNCNPMIVATIVQPL
jgi:hypothetical protein